tara:strand:+ start:403 stop:801 length:399 start_codon:yes stop_codon:yes gene_type:complete
MKNKNTDQIASIEKAIAKKYGTEAVANPRANWDEEKEKEYLKQMKELYQKTSKNEEYCEKIDINGIKVSKKLFNRESLKYCSVCGAFPKKSMDDVCYIKFDCCYKCYIQHVEGREERWTEGWRPNEADTTKP